MLCQDCHSLLEYFSHPKLSGDAWDSDEFVVPVTWIVRSVGHHRNVESGVVSFEIDKSLPHNGFEQTRLDEVDVVLTTHSVYRDAFQEHGSLQNYIKRANTLSRDAEVRCEKKISANRSSVTSNILWLTNLKSTGRREQCCRSRCL
jgi:hypothetical protein